MLRSKVERTAVGIGIVFFSISYCIVCLMRSIFLFSVFQSMVYDIIKIMKFPSGTGKRVVIREGEGGISRWY